MKTSPNVAKKTLAISMDYSGSGDKWKGFDYITPKTKARTIPGIKSGKKPANWVIIYSLFQCHVSSQEIRPY